MLPITDAFPVSQLCLNMWYIETILGKGSLSKLFILCQYRRMPPPLVSHVYLDSGLIVCVRKQSPVCAFLSEKRSKLFPKETMSKASPLSHPSWTGRSDPDMTFLDFLPFDRFIIFPPLLSCDKYVRKPDYVMDGRAVNGVKWDNLCMEQGYTGSKDRIDRTQFFFT